MGKDIKRAVLAGDGSCKSRLVFDLAIAGVLAVAAFAVSAHFEVFELFFELSREYEDYQLDEVVSAVLGLGLGSIVFSYRRFQDLRREIRRRTEAELSAARMAMHDPMTGLPNRRLFNDRLEKAIARGKRSEERLAVLMIDLDRFKPINDIHGHTVGDKLLIMIAERLQQSLREQDTLARMGGDEFAVVQVGIDSPNAALRLARRLIAAMEPPFAVDDVEVSVGLSLGICLWSEAQEAPDELIRRADVALMRAKRARRSELCFYEADMDVEITLRAHLENELRYGIGQGQIVVEYQPILDLGTERIVGVEALARWHHPTRGVIPPADFIPVAEDSNLIAALGETVLRQACRDALAWPEHMVVSVNISPLQFHDPLLAEKILDIVEEVGLPAERLELELTENALLEDPVQATKTIAALKAGGVRTALDDFGTGYSSLAHLRDLAFDKIKIDRSFVTSLAEDRHSAAIVRAVLALGRSLGVPTTAEGIESPQHLEALRAQGCVFGQGFLFSKAISKDEIDRRLAGRREMAGPTTGPRAATA